MRPNTVFRILLTDPANDSLQLSISAHGKIVGFRSVAAVRFASKSEADIYAMYVEEFPHVQRRGFQVRAVECSLKIPDEIVPRRKATWLSGLL